MSAFDCDRTSAFGGIIALNSKLDAETAEEISQIFTEVIIAPGADDAAKEILAKKKNVRLLLTKRPGQPADRRPDGEAGSRAATWCRTRTPVTSTWTT